MTSPEYSKLLTGDKPDKRLMTHIQKCAGRNNTGRITMRHQGAGNKRSYRLVDFVAVDKMNVPAKVETIEYDPYRTAFIMKLVYRDGERRYSLAPSEVKKGDVLLTAETAPVAPGNRMKLRNIPIGQSVFNVELNPGKGGQIIRSAGSFAKVNAQDAGYTYLKLSSGEIRRVLWDCFATIGQVSNPDWRLVVIGKAGRARGMNIRPTVRGSAMNPCDHPYGGGEGKQPRGTRKPKDIWGNITGGRKTRNKKKWSNVVIVERRNKKKK